MNPLATPQIGDLLNVTGLTAALWIVTQLVKLLVPSMQGVATIRFIFILGVVGSVLLQYALASPVDGKEIAEAVWRGVIAGAMAIGANVATNALRKPSEA